MKAQLKAAGVKGYSGKNKAQLKAMCEEHCPMPAEHKPEMFIQRVIGSPKFKAGAMTKAGARHGESALEYAKEVLANPDKHSVTNRRRAQFLINIQKRMKE
jgi:hypothetical protein